jgi:polar amino acid transport system permease protein
MAEILLENRPVDEAGERRWTTLRERTIWAIAALVLAYVVAGIAFNPAMRWDVIAEYITAPLILRGLWLTIVITAGSAAIGLIGGLVVAIARMSENPLIRTIAIGYINLFRAVPLLVQILIWYNLGTFLPQLGIGIPFTGIGFYAPTNDILSPMAACLVAIGLNQSAYMGEIIRGGLLSVQHGQIEAAVALGMTRAKLFWRVVAPQAARAVIPPMGNDVINLLKATSLVSVVGVGDLMTRAQSIYAATYQVIPLLLVASFWYLVLTALLSFAQNALERRFSAGTQPDRPAGRKAVEAATPQGALRLSAREAV